jgi:hypothetical protein
MARNVVMYGFAHKKEIGLVAGSGAIELNPKRTALQGDRD